MSDLSDDDWLELLRRSAAGQNVYLNGRLMPSMPDPDLQIRTVGQAGPPVIDEGWAFASECLARFRNTPNFGDDHKKLLDFGTGWGRIARCFLRDMPAENIVGVDVDGDLITVCRATFAEARFLRISPMPPLAFRDQTIDFVVGYSVFSHLSETACRGWMAEFDRILKPGGMVAMTTRGRWFFDYAAGLTGTDPYSRALSHMFGDFTDAKMRFDRGEFVHSNAHGVTGGGALDGSFYGESFIPEAFARECLGSESLHFVEYHAGGGHPILFFKKAG